MSSGGQKGRHSRRNRGAIRRRVRGVLLGVILPVLVLAGAGILVLSVDLSLAFEGRLWNVPSRIWSDSLTVRSPGPMTGEALSRRLLLTGYSEVASNPSVPGQFQVGRGWLTVRFRRFDLGNLSIPERRVRFEFDERGLRRITGTDGQPISSLDLEPQLLARVYGARHEERHLVALRDVPEEFVLAVLAAEDARFYSHHGFDPAAIVRATFANLRRGRIVQGASTITQQTVKNLYLGQERTFRRKVRELAMSVLLDLRYPKDRILEAYLNEVYLGQRGPVAICGAEAAARHFFGASLSDLGLSEWATLAGLIRNPGGYNPFRHPDKAIERRDAVLDSMVARGWLDLETAFREKRKPLRLSQRPTPISPAPYAVDWARSVLSGQVDARRLPVDGIDVRTTLDPSIQESAAAALRRGLDRLEAGLEIRDRERRLEGAAIVLDPNDGAVLALVGGRDYRTSQFNRAVQARRQPGSCFKPFVFLAGLEAGVEGRDSGITSATILEDEPLDVPSGGKRWRPENFDRTFVGPLPARRALEESRNVPTARLALEVGIDRVVEAAKRCGIETELRPLASIALGAQEVSPLELATAYATLAAGGRRPSIRVIREVSPSPPEGVVLPAPVPEVSPAVSYVLTDMLRGVIDRGTASSARALGFSGVAAGKTGTTDDERDAWFVGYTPDLVTLVWVGFDDGARTGLTGSSGALPIWVEIMRAAAFRANVATFPEPEGVVRVEIDPASGEQASSACPERREEVFVSGTEPATPCSLHERRFLRWLRRLFGRER